MPNPEVPAPAQVLRLLADFADASVVAQKHRDLERQLLSLDSAQLRAQANALDENRLMLHVPASGGEARLDLTLKIPPTHHLVMCELSTRTDTRTVEPLTPRGCFALVPIDMVPALSPSADRCAPKGAAQAGVTQEHLAPQVIEPILKRLQAVAHISINGGGENVGGKYYGTVVEVGMNELKLWHCESADVEKVLPSQLELNQGCGDKDVMTIEDFFGDCFPCSQHWQSQGDYDMAEFIVHAREDIAALLKLLGVEPPAIAPREW